MTSFEFIKEKYPQLFELATAQPNERPLWPRFWLAFSLLKKVLTPWAARWPLPTPRWWRRFTSELYRGKTCELFAFNGLAN